MATPESKPITTRQRSLPSQPDEIEVKPHLSDSEDDEISFSHQTESIKIQRELLRELYQEKNSKLDLQEVIVKMKEENHFLKKGRRSESGKAVLKMEPGIERDIKPVIPRCGEPGPSGTRDEVDDDMDEIVFLREVKGNAVNDITMSQVQTGGSQGPAAASSGSEAENLLNTVPITPQHEPSPTGPPSSSLPPRSFTRPKIPWPKTKQRLKIRSGPKHISQKQREVSLSSSSSDPQSDASDDTYDTSSDESTTVPAVSSRGKRMKAFGLRSRKSNHEKVNTKRKREGKDDLEDRKKETRMEKKPASDGKAGTSDRSQETEINVDAEDEDLSSSEDEEWSKYRGPRIKILSVKAINDRLERTFKQYGLSIGTIDDLAQWWPKTIVGKYHDFDTRHHYLLTRGVYEWWSRLCVKVNSPGHVWPDMMNEAKKTWLISRIKEITCQKEGAAERGKREMINDGDIVAADDEIDLDE